MMLSCHSVNFVYAQSGMARPVLYGIDCQVRSGEFLGIIGPSGCGKSTLLRLFAGLLTPTSGSIERIAEPGDGVGGPLLVRQEDSLFPWKTAIENAAFGLEIQGVDRQERLGRARRMLARFGLAGFENAYPKQLSAGMKQRVALARGFLSRPAMLLLDEPFAALDAQTRLALQNELLDIWSETRNLGAILVTHDVDEAILLCDRVVALGSGPARVVAEFPIPFSRPRTLSSTWNPHFLELKKDLLATLGVLTEVHAAHA